MKEFNINKYNLNRFKEELKGKINTTLIPKYKKSCIKVEREILGILKPKNVNDIQNIVKLADKYEIPIYTISTGKNWGYGSANPAINNCFIVDLSDMKKIELDTTLNTATLQPGVTQGDLYEYLIKNKLDYFVPTHGGGPKCSIVANAIERGYGITPYEDHFGALRNLKAVMANGEIYESSLGAKGCNELDRTFKYGFGPYINGLFTQNNIGIVTEATFSLKKNPEIVSNFYFWVKKDDYLEETVNIIKDILEQYEGIVGSINLMNDIRILSMMIEYPKDESKNNIISQEVIDKYAKMNMVSPWVGTGSIYGDKKIVRIVQKEIKKKLKKVSKLTIFFNQKRIKILKFLTKFIPFEIGKTARSAIKPTSKALDVMMGIPSEVALPLAYWKKGINKTSNYSPAQDDCNVLWYSPLVIMKGDYVRKYTDFLKKTCLKYNMDPLITLTSISNNIFDSTVPILFPDDYEKQAKDCYIELYKEGTKQGFTPYRISIDHFDIAIDVDKDKTFWKVNEKIKKALDPKNILSPGRYSTYDKNIINK